MKLTNKRIRKPHSEETKRKISETNIKIMANPEIRQKISKSNKGKILSVEHKLKMRIAKLGKKQSEDHRRNSSIAHQGNKSHFWQGGICPINKKIRSNLEYRLWRESVFQRDNYTCLWCGARSRGGFKVYLHADHIKPFALFPELRFALDNGRTLCKNCHETTDTFAGRIYKIRKEQ
jgi:hypothetical protein